MATTFEEDFEGGSNGVAITTSNTAFDSVSGSPIFTDSVSAVGTMAADCSTTAATLTRLTEDFTGPYHRFYIRMGSLPASNQYVCAVNQSSPGQLADLRINTDGAVAIRNGFSAVWTSSTAKLTAGKWARIEWKVDAGSSTQEVRVFVGANLHGTTPSESSGSQTYDKGPFVRVDTGVNTNTANIDLQIDGVKDDNATWVGPASVPNQPPTVTYPDGHNLLGAVDVEKSITALATDPDGSVEAWEWSWDSVTNASGVEPVLTGDDTATVKFTPTEGGIYGLKVRAQDDDSAWSDYAYCSVNVPSTIGVPIEDVSGNWTETGGTGVGILSDDNDSTYYQAATGGTSTQRFRLSPFVQPSAFSINVRHFLTASVAGSASATLYEGAATRKSWSLSPTETIKSTTLTLGSDEIAAITDWTNLFLEVTWQES